MLIESRTQVASHADVQSSGVARENVDEVVRVRHASENSLLRLQLKNALPLPADDKGHQTPATTRPPKVPPQESGNEADKFMARSVPTSRLLWRDLRLGWARGCSGAPDALIVLVATTSLRALNRELERFLHRYSIGVAEIAPELG
jgi:hypothetical protein